MLSCGFLHATERKRMKGTIDETVKKKKKCFIGLIRIKPVLLAVCQLA